MKIKNLNKLKNNIKKNIKSFKPSKTFIAITSFLIGIGTTVLAQNITQKSNTQKTYHLVSPEQDKHYYPTEFHHPRHTFEEDFFGHSLFEEIHQMQRHMDLEFARQRAHMNRIFHESRHNKKSHQNNYANITQKENPNEYIYELNFNGYKKENIEISIKNQTLTISAQNQQTQQNHHNSSNFYYSLHLPQYNKKTKPKITHNKNKITITLKK